MVCREFRVSEWSRNVPAIAVRAGRHHLGQRRSFLGTLPAMPQFLGTRDKLSQNGITVFVTAPVGGLVSRFRSSQTLAAHSHANFGIKETLASL
jgi:hypothetical protein